MIISANWRAKHYFKINYFQKFVEIFRNFRQFAEIIGNFGKFYKICKKVFRNFHEFPDLGSPSKGNILKGN